MAVCPVSCVPNVTSVSLDCPFLIAARFSLTFIYYLRYVLCLVYPMLPVSLECPFLIAPSVFSNVYLLPTVCPFSCVPNDTSVSLDCPFLIVPLVYSNLCPMSCVPNVTSVSLDCTILDCRSILSNVYLLPTVCPVSCVPNVTSVSGLSILDCARFSLTFIYYQKSQSLKLSQVF